VARETIQTSVRRLFASDAEEEVMSDFLQIVLFRLDVVSST
jgi:hypothetical protein